MTISTGSPDPPGNARRAEMSVSEIFRQEILTERKRFFLAEAFLVAFGLLIYALHYLDSPSAPPWYEDFGFYLTLVLGSAFGFLVHGAIAIFVSITRGVDEFLARFRTEVEGLKTFSREQSAASAQMVTDAVKAVEGKVRQEVRKIDSHLSTEFETNIAPVLKHMTKRHKPLSTEALKDLWNFLHSASTLYSVTYVRPFVWLRDGELLTVLALQAHVRGQRQAADPNNKLHMYRFIIWDPQDIYSPEGIDVIRASILVGARTYIFPKNELYRVFEALEPELHRFVEEEYHVWLACSSPDGCIEIPSAGRWGQVNDEGFTDPIGMMREQLTSPENFHVLIEYTREAGI